MSPLDSAASMNSAGDSERAFVVVHAKQRLGTDGHVGVDVDDRLVVHDDRVVVDRVPQLLFDCFATVRLFGQLRAVDLGAIASAVLRVGERMVGFAEQGLALLAAAGRRPHRCSP